MINIELIDGHKISFDRHVTGFEIAQTISKSLAKNALVIEVDGKLQDLSSIIAQSAKVRILTDQDQEVLPIIRHDAAHLLAEAVKELFPEVQLTIGPVIENGFYYDFAKDDPFTPNDLATIEQKMSEIVQRNEVISREVWQRDAAIEFFRNQKEFYKAEIIASIPDDQQTIMYRQGNFVDPCRGPHGPSTNKIKYFKLMKVAGAYWRGDSNNSMLQRIYGTAWASQEQLEQYLLMLEEAEKRDHRKIGRALDLFHFQDEAQGMPFWHSKGWCIYRIIEQYIRYKVSKAGYHEVKTPMLIDKSLWEASGHWDKFQENMFTSSIEGKVLALKPMNCPCHVQIFKQGIKSYKDLPLRMAEFGMCHRNEASGALHGLLRVRNFVQDDAHIFCTEDQITSETVGFCDLLKNIYSDFGFTEISVRFSDRPRVRAGTDEVWDKAEAALRQAVIAADLAYTLNVGEGAFYGPKLEFILRDAIGRDWQCGTLQVDFILPERLGAYYIDATGEKKHPVMLHRAILGTFERFIGIIIEQYAGKLPLWLAPVQVAVITVTNDTADYAMQLYNSLISCGIRSELDISAEKINYKIRAYALQKVPLTIVVGKREAEDGSVSVRRLGINEHEVMSLQHLINYIQAENVRYLS